MLTIQEVGTEIMQGTPRSFYVMTGGEYGIKRMYIQYLKNRYKQYKEADSVESVFSIMTTKHFVPLEPTVYVVRYDESFINSLNEKSASRIKSINIIGTIVCLYESDKHNAKAEKYLEDYTVHIDKVNDQFIKKYLKKDFPELDDNAISAAVESCADWYESELMCKSMMLDDPNHLRMTSKSDLKIAFGKAQEIDEKSIKPIIASKNFYKLLYMIEKKQGEEDSVLYSILATMLELEKISSNKYVESDLKHYQKNWTLKDIYNMFMQTYQQLQYMRSVSPDPQNVLMYLITLMQFSEIPSVEVLS